MKTSVSRMNREKYSMCTRRVADVSIEVEI